MEFNNTPFSIEKETILDCQHGSHYYGTKENKGKRKQLRLQGTKKVGCSAKIKIKKYVIYKEYSLPKDILVRDARGRKRLQENKLEELKAALQSNKPLQIEEKYYVSLPTETAHTGHPTGQHSGFGQRIHPLLVEQITDLVSSGITNTGEVKKILHHYVKNNLVKQIGIELTISNRALFPTDIDIRNHIATAKRVLELSKLDQENLRLKIMKWQESYKNSKYFFRPYIKSATENEACNIKPDTKTESRGFKGNTADGESNIFGSDEHYQQTLLLVHQENWQQQLLQKYGNVIAMIDATHKTTRYDLALFFVCVRTNVGYMVIAEFIVQAETSELIPEALNVLKPWNPGWDPKYFMSDYSEAEHDALEHSFPGVKVYLCDFHREQCLERWVKDSKHNLTKREGQQLLDILRDCAQAPPGTLQENLPLEFHYYFKS